mgnify:CR=1 FL=1
MIRFRRKDSTPEKLRENLDHREQIAKAERLSQDMRVLAAVLIEKAKQLEGELNHAKR